MSPVARSYLEICGWDLRINEKNHTYIPRRKPQWYHPIAEEMLLIIGEFIISQCAPDI